MSRERYESGLQLRRQVLGDAYVDRVDADIDPLAAPLRELVIEYGWGAVWGRPGLDRRTRSIINLAMLTALNRPHELRLHLRGALHNGVTPDEIAELLIQAAVYCGAPAALDAMRDLREVLAEPEFAALRVAAGGGDAP